MTPMRFTQFSVTGFRSIKAVELTPTHLGPGPAVVLYGENGAGKSNILAAMARFWGLLEACLRQGSIPALGSFALGGECQLSRSDVHQGSLGGVMEFSATVAFPKGLTCGKTSLASVAAQFTVVLPADGTPTFSVDSFVVSRAGHPGSWAASERRDGGVLEGWFGGKPDSALIEVRITTGR